MTHASMKALLEEIRQRLRHDVIQDACAELDGASDGGHHARTLPFDVSLSRPGFGDASSNAAFLLAGRLKMSPSDIARAISAKYNERNPLGGLVVRSVPHPSGHVNFEADWAQLSEIILSGAGLDTFGDSEIGGGTPVTVEHTSVNPNKALHIGHVRNIIIGDTVSRILRKSGHAVKVLNYVDDSGLQVADVVVGFRHLGFSMDPPPGKTFAQYCGDEIYVKTTQRYDSDPSLEGLRRDTLREIEDGSTEAAKLAGVITRRVLADQLQTCWRLSVYYDCLNFESHIIRSGMWGAVFDKLKDMNLVDLDRSGGKNDGCWVIRDAHGAGAGRGEDTGISDGSSGSSGSSNARAIRKESPPEENRDKVIVRSNGTATYIAKDIPYAAWKLGLVDDPFGYVRYDVEQPGGTTLWQTALGRSDGAMNFAGERVITVIDSRQSGLQRIVSDLMGRFKSSGSAYVHLAYESVTLSSDTARALGMETDKRQAHMSGRRGLYVDADSVYEELRKKAAAETLKRHPDMGDPDVARISRDISVGTIRYEMIKQDLDKVIAFDMERSLSLEGDTASYIQYAGARASRILEKAGREPPDAVDFGLLGGEDAEVALIRAIGSFEMAVEDAARNLSPKVVARYCHDLAVSFNAFYERSRVLGLDDPGLEDARLYLVRSFRFAVTRALGLVGISAPDVM
ncbi:MAG: arginine--tRNA ligase [Thaumarchaeota archaeon]|nr:arginine--tRNA ligase [Nitrososphaerota archaeon]